MKVVVTPLPMDYKSIPARLRPLHPPVFPEGSPGRDDIKLAQELYLLLDPESREWYYRPGGIFPHPDTTTLKKRSCKNSKR